jgi:ankyrin repeat protein
MVASIGYNWLKVMLFVTIGLACRYTYVSAQQKFALIDTSDYLTYPEGFSANLAIAASKGYVSEIHRLISLGASPNGLGKSYIAPLVYAVAQNKKAAVSALLMYNPNLDYYSYNNGIREAVLHIAARNNNVEIAELLIMEDADPDIRDSNECTPLHIASIYGYFYMADLLLYYEADIDAITSDGTTPLMAATWSGYADIVDYLLVNGAKVNLSDSKGFTALHIAAQNGDTLITRLLLDAGADISFTTKADYDIGTLAARTGNEVYSKFVLESTKWIDEKDPDSVNPLTIARKFGQKEVYQIFSKEINSGLKSFSINHFQISLNMKFNHDIYLGGMVSFIEPLYKFRFNLGLEFKPTYTRVLEKIEENVNYQYHDKRYLFYAGAGKNFRISEDLFRGYSSIILNINFGYLVANSYLGTERTPPDKFVFMPSFGFEKSINRFSARCMYEYMDTDLYKAGPHWLKFGISYTLQLEGTKASLKNITWY